MAATTHTFTDVADRARGVFLGLISIPLDPFTGPCPPGRERIRMVTPWLGGFAGEILTEDQSQAVAALAKDLAAEINASALTGVVVSGVEVHLVRGAMTFVYLEAMIEFNDLTKDGA